MGPCGSHPIALASLTDREPHRWACVAAGWQHILWRSTVKGVLQAASDAGRHHLNKGRGKVGKPRWDGALQRHSDIESKQLWQVTACDREVRGRPEGTLPNRVCRKIEPPKFQARGIHMMQEQEDECTQNRCMTETQRAMRSFGETW